MSRLAPVLLACLVGCNGTDAGAPGAGVDGEASEIGDAGPGKDAVSSEVGDAGTEPDAVATWELTGSAPIDPTHESRSYRGVGCGDLGPGAEDCHVKVVWSTAACAETCSRLVVYWAGGEQGCTAGNYDPLLVRYADEGFVAVCAQPFTTSDEAGRYPYVAEAPRMGHVLQAVRSLVSDRWTGQDLLHAGVSHGATALPLAIASLRAFDTAPGVWEGTAHTAVVLFDGISNPATLDEWAGGDPGCSDLHARWVGRYGDGAPAEHACDNNACFCSQPEHAADWPTDSTQLNGEHPVSPYACADFASTTTSIAYRYVSCSGQGGPPCGPVLGDVIPDDQQQLPASELDACPGLTASWQRYGLCSHVLCGSWLCGGADTIAWLEGLGW